MDSSSTGAALAKMPLIDQPGAELFNAWRMGEIGQEDWFVFEAARALETQPSPYQPESLPALPETLRSYCEKRILGTLPYDPELAKRLGNWFMVIQRRAMGNEEKRGTIAWAIEKCESKALTGLVNKGKALLSAFDSVSLPEGINAALEAKRVDANARTKGASQ